MASAQETYTIKGFILDANTQNPIIGANIVGENMHAVSSLHGEFIIENVLSGMHTFEITHIGYVTEHFTLEVNQNISDVSIKLKEEVTNLEEVELLGKSEKRK